jgi:hypothetical protein
VSGQETGTDPGRPPASDPSAASDAGPDPEAVAAWTSRDAEAVAADNRALAFRRHRLRADVRSLASEAVATLRELITGPDVPPAVRLKACLTILQAAEALETEEPGPLSARGVQAKLDHRQLIDALGG